MVALLTGFALEISKIVSWDTTPLQKVCPNQKKCVPMTSVLDVFSAFLKMQFYFQYIKKSDTTLRDRHTQAHVHSQSQLDSIAKLCDWNISGIS